VLGKKNESTEHSKGNKTIPGKVTTEEEMEGPTASWGSRNRKHAETFMNKMMMTMMNF